MSVTSQRLVRATCQKCGPLEEATGNYIADLIKSVESHISATGHVVITTEPAPPKMTPGTVLLRRIRPSRNIRADVGDLTELVASIRQHGILHPIVVQPDTNNPSMFTIIAGHRRWAAAMEADLLEVPIVISEQATWSKTIQLQLVENLQRTDLNPMERAEALGWLRDMGMTGRQIAGVIGQSEGSVSMYLSLLELPEEERVRLRSGDVSRADAVRQARSIRVKSGHPRGGAPAGSARAACASLHFTNGHPLAAFARRLCDTAGHPLKRRIGKVACGQCWEMIIRMDEAGVPVPELESRPRPLLPGSPEWKARRAQYQRAYTARKRAEHEASQPQ